MRHPRSSPWVNAKEDNMDELVVLVVEDEPEVRAAVVRDLAPFTEEVRVDEAEDVNDAMAALAECDAEGDHVGLVLADHRLPGRTGVDLLVSLHDSEAHRHARKVLITGQADQADTIRAVNDAGLDHYIAKPWDEAELVAVVRDQLTGYVLDRTLNPLAYLKVLDSTRLLEGYGGAIRPD